jgi:Ca2+-binding RTX toxin-like protein
MGSTVKLKGGLSDYRLMPMSGSAHPSMALVGISPYTKDVFIRLDGVSVLEFAQGKVKLADVVEGSLSQLASLPNHHAAQGGYDENLNQGEQTDVVEPQYLTHDSVNQIFRSHYARSVSGNADLSKATDKDSDSKSDRPYVREKQITDTHSHRVDSTASALSPRAPKAASDPSSPVASTAPAGASNASPSSSPSAASLSNYNPTSSATSSANSNVKADVAVDYFPKELFGTVGSDTLYGAEGNDQFYTSGGNDYALGYGGVDTLIGVDLNGLRINQIAQGIFQLTGNVAQISEGADTLPVYGAIASNSNILFSGVEYFKYAITDQAVQLSKLASSSAFDDVLTPLDSSAAWVVNGLVGNDQLIGGSQGDQIEGGAGNDIIDGGANATLSNAAFYEALVGGDGADKITYQGITLDTSTLAGVTVTANLDGGAGNDLLAVQLDGITQVSLAGGDGIDTLALQAQGQDVWSSTFMDWQFTQSGAQYLLKANYHSPALLNAGLQEASSAIEKIALGLSGAGQSYQLIRPTLGAETQLNGTSGDDLFIPVDGVQTLMINAGAGNDVVIASSGSTISLGSGVNSVYAKSNQYALNYDWSTNGLHFDMASKLGMIFDGSGDFVAIDRFDVGPSHITSTTADDILSGDDASTTFNAGAGGDQILTGAGNDHVLGGAGNDIITVNGVGHKTLDGGEGADQFILNFDFASSSTVSVTDFSASQRDHMTIDLSNYSSALGQYFSSYQLTDLNGDLIFSGQTDYVSGADLHLIFNQEVGTVSLIDNHDQNFVDFGAHAFDGLSSAQIASLISVDYL